MNRIYNYSDDPRHDLEIYEQEQERMDKREERLEQLTKEAEEMYRTEEFRELLRWCVDNSPNEFFSSLAQALRKGEYKLAGLFLGELIDVYAPHLAQEYAEKILENEED